LRIGGQLEELFYTYEGALIHEFHFQREDIVDINAAVVGISRSRRTKVEPNVASNEHSRRVMKANGFDVLPIDDGRRVHEYFNAQELGVYAPTVWMGDYKRMKSHASRDRKDKTVR
jgi:hypothetical protein